MTEEKPDKKKPLPLPKTYKEFYPKNFSKNNQETKPKYPLEKESASFYPKSHYKQNKRKNSEKSDDYSDDDYSGLAFKNTNENQPKKTSNYKIKKSYRYSEDYNNYNYNYNNDYKTKWKTEMCHYWEMYGTCKFGDTCAFAHGAEELNKRKMSSNYKTKPCKQFFELGCCTYGVRCQFSHKLLKECDEEDKVSYMKILNEFNDSNKLISHEVVKRPRLKTFEDIFKCENDIKEKNRLELYEDILKIKEDQKGKPSMCFSEETNDDDNKEIKKEDNENKDNNKGENTERNNNSEENNNENNNGKKRARFISI